MGDAEYNGNSDLELQASPEKTSQWNHRETEVNRKKAGPQRGASDSLKNPEVQVIGIR